MSGPLKIVPLTPLEAWVNAVCFGGYIGLRLVTEYLYVGVIRNGFQYVDEQDEVLAYHDLIQSYRTGFLLEGTFSVLCVALLIFHIYTTMRIYDTIFSIARADHLKWLYTFGKLVLAVTWGLAYGGVNLLVAYPHWDIAGDENHIGYYIQYYILLCVNMAYEGGVMVFIPANLISYYIFIHIANVKNDYINDSNRSEFLTVLLGCCNCGPKVLKFFFWIIILISEGTVVTVFVSRYLIPDDNPTFTLGNWVDLINIPIMTGLVVFYGTLPLRLNSIQSYVIDVINKGPNNTKKDDTNVTTDDPKVNV